LYLLVYVAPVGTVVATARSLSSGAEAIRFIATAFFLVHNIPWRSGAKLVRAELYTALMFRGRPRVPAYVAELVLAPPGG